MDVSGAIKSRADGSGYNYHIFDTTGVTNRGSIYSGPSSINYAGWSGVGLSFTSNNSSNGLTLSSDGTKALFSGMNVGIGPVATQKFQVSGINGSPATSGTTQNGSVAFSYGTTYSTTYFDGYVGSPYGNWIQVSDRTDLSQNMPLILQPNGGNIGVGTSTPSTKLHVIGGAMLGESASNGVGFFPAVPGSSGTSCDTHCANADSTYNFHSSSGACIKSWNASTGAIATCSDTAFTVRCLCAGMF